MHARRLDRRRGVDFGESGRIEGTRVGEGGAKSFAPVIGRQGSVGFESSGVLNNARAVRRASVSANRLSASRR